MNRRPFFIRTTAAKKSRFFLATKQFDPVRIIRAVGSGQWAVVDVDVVIVLSYSICFHHESTYVLL